MFVPYPASRSYLPRSSRWLPTLLIILLALGVAGFVVWRLNPTTLATPLRAADFGRQPLTFIPNAGQTDPTVRFHARGMGGQLFFTEDEVVLALPTAGQAPDSNTSEDGITPPVPQAVVRLQFEGAAPDRTLIPAERGEGMVNFIIGNDPAQWQQNLPTHQGVIYENLYPGIALRYDGTEGALKGTYTVAPGVDPSQIRWRYSGTSGVELDPATGDLHLALAAPAPGEASPGRLVESAPVAWQDIEGRRVPVTTTYVVASDESIGFAVGAYNATHPLIIDPFTLYSTYLGGAGDDSGASIALGPGGVYIVGRAGSLNFPTTPNGYQREGEELAFLTKLDPNGALVYSTYLGGTSFGASANDVVLDGDMAVIVGVTGAPDFPVTANAYQSELNGALDLFLLKVRADGTAPVYSSYFGGSGVEVGPGAIDIARPTNTANPNDYTFIGRTNSTDLPTTPNAVQRTAGGVSTSGLYDTFVTVLNTTNNTLRYSTYLGGSGQELSGDIAAIEDRSSAIFVTGNTDSDDFPVKNALQATRGGDECESPPCSDAFLTRLNIDSVDSLEFSTYWGGSSNDAGYGIALELFPPTTFPLVAVWVTGATQSANFPLSSPLPGHDHLRGVQDAFVFSMDKGGTESSFSSYFGGAGNDTGESILLDSIPSLRIPDNIYITGYTNSADFPQKFPINAYGGGFDAFVSKLTRRDGLTFSTFLGGSGDDFASALDVYSPSPNSPPGVDLEIYVTGRTVSTDFPVTGHLFPTVPPAQAAPGGGSCENFLGQPVPCSDAFVTKIEACPMHCSLSAFDSCYPHTDRLAAVQGGAFDIELFYRVRDEVMVGNPEGQRLSELYYATSPDVIEVALTRSDVRQEFLDTVQLWEPNLRALVDGQGGSTVITQEQVQALQSVLDHLAEAAGPDSELARVIREEQERMDLEQYIGKTMEVARTGILTPTATEYYVYLPLIRK